MWRMVLVVEGAIPCALAFHRSSDTQLVDIMDLSLNRLQRSVLTFSSVP